MVHLFVQSCYTLLESTVRIPDLVRRAKELGYDSVALTDRNVMHGAASFIRACEKEGMHGIIGLQVEVMYHETSVPFLLLAKDNAGYANLIRLSSMVSSQKDPCTLEEFHRHAGHCFIIAFGEGGWLDSELVGDQREQIYEKLQIMKKELPPFDIALSFQDASLWKMRNAVLKRIAATLNIRTCALNKIYYLERNDADAWQMLTAIRQGKMITDSSLPLIQGRYMLSKEEMSELYEQDDLRRTDEIAAECRADYHLPKTELPSYKVKYDVSADQYLPKLCMAGLKKRLKGREDERYIRRMKYELDVILKMHFADYFLIVYDFIRFARKQGILVGPGRGSAAGSLVAYCLGITQIDPIRYNLLFERFLNPERVSMPDIDTDIPDDRREEVIRYVMDTYGHEHVGNIITFGTLGARQVIRDVAKAMNIPSRETDMLTRAVGSNAKTTLKDAYDHNPRMRQLIQADLKLQKLYAMALRLEGLPRHASVHAAGIVLSSRPLKDVIPVIELSEGIATTQFTMEYLEERGLIKMDFLGLRNLTIIDEIVRMIRKDEPDFELMQIPLNDAATYQVFARADTIGVFQFESEGMKNLLRRMRPGTFEDVVAALALYRPASKDSIPDYINAKADPAKIRYPLKELKPVLQETYGVMIYQEQAMMTARIAAGFSLAKADVLRKAMSKKKENELLALKNDFISGCLARGHEQKTAEELFELVSRFGGYGFNKSHAVAYGLISYQMAYLKARYPLYFYTALLNSVIGDEVRTSQYIDECRKRKITVSAPDVNRSQNSCFHTGSEIILPLSIVKGVGDHVASVIIQEREDNGSYEDFFDFTARCIMHKVSRTVMENLIDAGALDCLEINRRTMKYGMDEAMRYGDLVQISSGAQASIDLGLVSKPVLVRMKESEEEKSENEKNVLGFNLGMQPIVLLREKLNIHVQPIASMLTAKGYADGFALVRNVHPHRTKYGDMMAFLKLSDETGEIDMAVMPDIYQKISQNLVRGTYILFSAKINDDGSLKAQQVRMISKK